MNVRKRIKLQARTLDALSTVLVLIATFYCWSVLRMLPDTFWVKGGIFFEEARKLDKSAVWWDIALMAGLYVSFSMIEMIIERLRIERPIRRIKPRIVTAWFKFGLLLWFAVIIVANLSATDVP